MNSFVKICVLLITLSVIKSETFTGRPEDIPAQSMLSYQYSSLLLEFQSLTAFSRAVAGWNMMTSIDINGQSSSSSSSFEEDDFVLEEDHLSSSSSPSRKQIESQTEFSFMTYLKNLQIITARKLESAQNIHYQSRLVTSALQGMSATNPMSSSLLYMLYYRDVLQTLMSAQSIQRHDSWTVWNFLEMMETQEDASSLPKNLIHSIKHAYATAMRGFATEAMLDFQTFMIDYYLQPMLSQAAGVNVAAQVQQPTAAANPTSFVEEEVSVQAQPGKPFFGPMSSPQSMMYFMFMYKFYAKYIVLNAAQSLANEAALDLHHFVLPSADNSKLISNLPHIRISAISGLQQWAQIKFFLLYMDMYTLFAAPGSPRMGGDGPAAHLSANSLVQTVNEVQIPQTPVEQVKTPVIENQVPDVVAPAVPVAQVQNVPAVPVLQVQNVVAPVTQVQQQVPQQQQAPIRQSVVG
eukprot:c20425_g1_i2.p1 GENE.c20425_g1_i2~~c20425_g1_i2.p1  ORF type:complete len:482 (+),score=230.84 c20425_g1_i2:56-1447(+)